MESDNNKKHQGKAQRISDKYRFSKFESYTHAELLNVLRGLYRDLRTNEKIIEANELLMQKKDVEIELLKKKLDVFYNPTFSVTKYTGYNPDWLYIDKVCFVIQRTRKPLNSHQIVELLIKIEPSLSQRLSDPFNSISKSIYNAAKLNRLFRYQKTGNFGYTYIIPSWLDENGKLKIK